MKPRSEWPEVSLFYVTRDGQTRRIAERMAELLRREGVDSEAIDVRTADERGWSHVRAVALGAPVYNGRYGREAIEFARRHRDELARVPSLFFSVCLAIRSRHASDRYAAERIA